jgi:hypothetical protein
MHVERPRTAILGVLLLGLLTLAPPARANAPEPGFVDTLVVAV